MGYSKVRRTIWMMRGRMDDCVNRCMRLIQIVGIGSIYWLVRF